MDLQVPIKNILFFDIETVSGKEKYQDLSEDTQKLWNHKASYLLRKPKEELEFDEVSQIYSERAAIFAEFGKIVCISAGIFSSDDVLRVKSFYSDDESTLLQEFSETLNQYFGKPFKKIDYQGNKIGDHFICGHNIKEFDSPYICRRLLINQLKFPEVFKLQGKKPWETKHQIDTMELWKFGDGKNYTSLSLLTNLFGVPTPKDDIDGSQVGKVYYEENDLERIARYCEKDVVATAQLYRRMNYMPLLEDNQIKII